jgi:DNA ligase (NAD+)
MPPPTRSRRASAPGRRAGRSRTKLPAVEKITRLVEVRWNVGRTGVIAPRAVLEPVQIEGATVTFVTLHNAADIGRQGLLLGDHVTVYKFSELTAMSNADAVATLC